MKKLAVDEIRELTEQIAIERLMRRASEIDQKRSFPWDGIRALGEAGLLGVVV
ncbi:MAG: isovaleryl-CoA dehydrogenase, partial [candidate division Zixibacteria bacterium]|nr:isovaleryl-CoA dehydrogenase [candidate division Zixibacteria bacterium]